jgi:hypothetical protein
MQHEWIGIPTKLCDDERYALGHQASDKRHIARKSVELGNNYLHFAAFAAAKAVAN